ncbi:MAG: DUF123 domain-containing protein [Gammaproteobacteria bacterium]|nr:DUF123 domain-containing protein [Gammaproteobacteria bacterium]
MTGAEREVLPATPGTYALVLESRARARVQVGRWGELYLQPGYYVYVGSAFGPGGIRARVGRHLRGARSKRWHIDYLRAQLEPHAAWFSTAERRLEHDWARAISGMDSLTPVARFGCSDCQCHTHLFHAATAPDLHTLSARVVSPMTRLAIDDAQICFMPRLELPRPDAVLMRRMLAEVPWAQQEIVVYGRTRPQPRLTAWFGDPGAEYQYSGLRLHPHPWSSLLLELKARVEHQVGVSFNSVLLNYYRNERDSVGLHSDDEPELGPEPVIASLSLGATRTLTLQHKRRKSIRSVQLPLTSGSLLLMQGQTQRNWRHGINKSRQACGPRVNLTFRQIQAPGVR